MALFRKNKVKIISGPNDEDVIHVKPKVSFFFGRKKKSKKDRLRHRSSSTLDSSPRIISTKEISLDKELKKKGLSKNGPDYYGVIHYRNGRLTTRLIRRYGISYELFIMQPPFHLIREEFRSCFMVREDGWYLVHYHNANANISPISMITSLVEMLEGR